MINLNTNLSSLITQRSLSTSTQRLNQAIEQMTTGFKINHAKDNAANYNITTNMTTKIGAYMVAEDNCAMGLNLISTAEGSLNKISDKLSRLRALAVQTQNGTYGGKSLEAINQEAESIVAEIKREYSTTEYNGLKLFNVEKEETIEDSGVLDEFADLERVSKATTLEANKSYRIDDANDLIALQNYVNNGTDTTNMTFELTTNIDMQSVTFRGIGNSSYSFNGTFNGNEHYIENLKINTTEDYVGLFGKTSSTAIISSLGLSNVNITGGNHVGGLYGYGRAKITHCYVSGSVEGLYYVGGLVGSLYGKLEHSFFVGKVKGTHITGGAVGDAGQTAFVEHCYSSGDVSGNALVGGLIGDSSCTTNRCFSTATATGTEKVGGLAGSIGTKSYDCYALGAVSASKKYCGGFTGYVLSTGRSGRGNYYNIDACPDGDGIGYGSSYFDQSDPSVSALEGKTADEILAICTSEIMGFTESEGWSIKYGTPIFAWAKLETDSESNGVNLDGANVVSFQVGVNSGASSGMSFDLAFSLIEIDDVMTLGLADSGCLSLLDSMILRVSDKAIEYGAMQNRLESALDEISVQYENLVSSRSTLRDADISEVSSEYIRQQILQQASATLMATANQSPSIALQLI